MRPLRLIANGTKTEDNAQANCAHIESRHPLGIQMLHFEDVFSAQDLADDEPFRDVLWAFEQQPRGYNAWRKIFLHFSSYVF